MSGFLGNIFSKKAFIVFSVLSEEEISELSGEEQCLIFIDPERLNFFLKKKNFVKKDFDEGERFSELRDHSILKMTMIDIEIPKAEIFDVLGYDNIKGVVSSLFFNMGNESGMSFSIQYEGRKYYIRTFK
jgi:hypothetical protein